MKKTLIAQHVDRLNHGFKWETVSILDLKTLENSWQVCTQINQPLTGT